MRLSVKNPEACRLASEIAKITGESITQIVTQALRERYAHLDRRKGRASVKEMLAIADRVAAHVKGAHADHGELLYDEYGLPRR